MDKRSIFFILLGATGGALVFLVFAVRSYLKNRQEIFPSKQAPQQRKSAARSRFGRFGALLRPSDDIAAQQMLTRLTRAGIYSQDSVDLYLAVRMVLIIAGLVVFVATLPFLDGLLLTLFCFVLIIGVVLLAPSFWLDSRTNKRKVEVSRTLPSTLDLLVTCLDAGLNLEQALMRISANDHHGTDIFVSELRMTLEEIRAGIDTTLAFRRMADRLGHEEVHNLAALIGQASQLGGNIAEALRSHSHTIRKQRLIFLEEQAGKANAKLTLPLTTCLLPAVMILLLGPAIVMILESM